jgi:ABC-type spermidine/putrescine transport system permease subunit II
MLVSTLGACFVYDRVFGLSRLSGEGTVDGKGGRLRLAGLFMADRLGWLMSAVTRGVGPLGRGRLGRVLLPAYSSVIFAFLILPMLVVIPMAFTTSSFLQFPPPGFGFRWFEAYFTSPVWIDATLRSFGVAFVTAILATLIGGVAAVGLARSRSRLRGIVFSAFLAPLIVPRIVTAVGLYYLFASVGLVASDVGLVIGHTLLAMPFALVAIAAVLKTYDWRLNEVAATLGATRFRAFRLVTMPLIRAGLLAAGLFAFIKSFDELTVALFISGGVKTTLPKQMWDDLVMQLNPTLAAVSVVMFVVITALLLLAERLRREA